MSPPRGLRPPPRGRIAWALALLLLALLVAALAGVAIYQGISQIGHAPLSIVIDGDEIVNGLDLGSMPPLHKLVMAVSLSLLVLVLLVVLPLAVAIGVTLILAAVLAAVSVPVLAVVLVLAIVCSPLWIVLALLWWLLRRNRSRPAAGKATMP